MEKAIKDFMSDRPKLNQDSQETKAALEAIEQKVQVKFDALSTDMGDMISNHKVLRDET